MTYESLKWARKNVETNQLKVLRAMTNDKVRQDFEAAEGFKRECPLTDELADKGDIRAIEARNFSLKSYQAGRAAERAEIVAKLESAETIARAIALAEMKNIATEDVEAWLNRVWPQKIPAAKAAITRILEVI